MGGKSVDPIIGVVMEYGSGVEQREFAESRDGAGESMVGEGPLQFEISMVGMSDWGVHPESNENERSGKSKLVSTVSEGGCAGCGVDGVEFQMPSPQAGVPSPFSASWASRY